MIIRENDIVVGMLEDSSLKLTGVTSDKLSELVSKWRKDGIDLLVPPQQELEEGQASLDAFITVPFTSENISVFRNQLLREGFEVQTA